jgi:hypothetical protein
MDGDCLRKFDIVLSSTVSNNTGEDTYDPEMFSISEKRLSWKTIRLAAELKQSNKYSEYDSTVAQLANYIREIFGSQQTRMWVHGFTLCGDEFRAWLFDRAGGLGTRLVNVHKEPSIFIKAIIGFACMGSSQLGFDPTIRWKPQGGEPNVVYDATLFHTLLNPPLPYIKVETKDFTECLEIDVRHPLARRIAIHSRGTAVFAGRLLNPDPVDKPPAKWDYAVKEQWRAPLSSIEANILQSISSSIDIIGLPRYYFHRDLGRVSTLIRQNCGMNAVTITPPSPVPQGSQAAVKDTIGTLKRSAPSGGLVSSIGTKRLKTAMGKVGGSNGRMVGGADDNHWPVDMVGESTLLTAGIWTFNDRTKSRLVISPIGTPLHQFKSYTQLLMGIRDAVKGIDSPLQSWRFVIGC